MMKRETRRRFFFALLFITYLVILVTITLLPDGDVGYEPGNNLVPGTSIDDYIYDVYHNGILNTDYIRSGETDGVATLYHYLTYPARNLFGNILLFVPLGLLYPLCRKNKTGWIQIMAVVLGSTILIEILQHFFLSSRSADVDDIILNFIGGMLGYFLYKWVE
ncbi:MULTISPECIES: VanZ family protein [Eubacterium]|nr:VanZ family protein [Eubacterium barkeri]